jgi:hypothetical protein
MKNFFTSTAFKRFCWTILDAVLSYLITYISGIDASWTIPLTAILQYVTKLINETYLQKTALGKFL